MKAKYRGRYASSSSGPALALLMIGSAALVVGCAATLPLIRGRSAAGTLAGAHSIELQGVVVPDSLHSEQLEHELRVAFSLATESMAGLSRVGNESLDGAAVKAWIRLDRRPYTHGMRRYQIMTLTLELEQGEHVAVAVINTRVSESRPSSAVLHTMTARAYRRAERLMRPAR